MSHTPSSPGSRPVASSVLTPTHRLIISLLFREVQLSSDSLLARPELLHVAGLMGELDALARNGILYLYADGWGLTAAARELMQLGQESASYEVTHG
ncbi:MAG TPA: hypothetical protein VFZ09_01295 [Archangium sp.]|uniref:hypothetical protein n=1 Tax=Archangium sp. TaxID=1872627 RepID=UPI002E380FDE|nr:hypothetical protein [Archangium sp.]HEX5744844.1 hypothetical protein [Archangium sp.]